MKSLVRTAPTRALGRRGAALAAWTIPGALLAVLPKCPACFAAYAALWTGIGLSMPMASGLRWALMGACLASLGFLTFRLVRRSLARKLLTDREASRGMCCGELYDTPEVTSPFTATAETTGTAGLARESTTFIRP